MNKNNLTLTPDACERFVNFPVWNLASVEIEPPSRYFALMPIGTGTGKAESLCSYIARLAEAHCVSPTRILFYSATGQTASLPFSLQEKSLPATLARTINGAGKTAESLAPLIRKTTSINGIEQHTFLPWKHLISRHKLLNDVRSWCPACYNEQFQEQGFMYEKLAWSVNCVIVCPIHRIHLARICPYCAKKQKHLGNTSRVGFCDHCRKWLGRTEDYGRDNIGRTHHFWKKIYSVNLS